MKICSTLFGLLLLLPQLSFAQAVLNANQAASNNGGSLGSALLFDLQATTGVVITGFTTASLAAPGTTYTVRVHSRGGSALGGPVAAGVGSSAAGWSLLGTVTAIQGAGEVSLPVSIPDLRIAAGQKRGIALEFVGAGPRYFGTASPPLEVYSNSNLTLTTGDARSAPFTTTGTWFSSRALIGSIRYRLEAPVLQANPGPNNNGGSMDSGMFFNLQSSTGAVVTGLTTDSTALANTPYQIDVHTRTGTALGNVTGTGPATSTAGWTLRGTVSATQGEAANGRSLPIVLPPITVPAGDTVGVGLVFRGAAPRYFGTGVSSLENYGNANLSLVTGEAMTTPFSTSSVVFTSRALVGSLTWRPATNAQLDANPGPSDNGGVTGSGMFLNLAADAPATVNALRVATTTPANGTFAFEMYTRLGNVLGGGLATGPTSSPLGWVLHASVTAQQGATGEVSLPISIPDLVVAGGQTLGLALVFPNSAPRYVGSGISAPLTYGNPLLRVTTGEARSIPFTTGGTFFASRELIGTLYFNSADLIFRNGLDSL